MEHVYEPCGVKFWFFNFRQIMRTNHVVLMFWKYQQKSTELTASSALKKRIDGGGYQLLRWSGRLPFPFIPPLIRGPPLLSLIFTFVFSFLIPNIYYFRKHTESKSKYKIYNNLRMFATASCSWNVIMVEYFQNLLCHTS